MSDEMIERVARAIWLKLSGPEFDDCEEAARAAIEAMQINAVPCGVCGLAVYPQLPLSVTVGLPEAKKTL